MPRPLPSTTSSRSGQDRRVHQQCENILKRSLGPHTLFPHTKIETARWRLRLLLVTLAMCAEAANASATIETVFPDDFACAIKASSVECHYTEVDHWSRTQFSYPQRLVTIGIDACAVRILGHNRSVFLGRASASASEETHDLRPPIQVLFCPTTMLPCFFPGLVGDVPRAGVFRLLMHQSHSACKTCLLRQHASRSMTRKQKGWCSRFLLRAAFYPLRADLTCRQVTSQQQRPHQWLEWCNSRVRTQALLLVAGQRGVRKEVLHKSRRHDVISVKCFSAAPLVFRIGFSSCLPTATDDCNFFKNTTD